MAWAGNLLGFLLHLLDLPLQRLLAYFSGGEAPFYRVKVFSMDRLHEAFHLPLDPRQGGS